MDCSNGNQNAHYLSRNGRNMVCDGMNSGRNNCGNMMRNRNNCNHMNQMRNNCGNMMQNRNSCGTMNRPGDDCGNMRRHEDKWHDMKRDMDCDKRDKEKRECECMKEMHREKRDEGCDRGREPVDKMMLAMSYVPWQKWEDIYCMEEGLERGTIFAQLDKPYIGRFAK